MKQLETNYKIKYTYTNKLSSNLQWPKKDLVLQPMETYIQYYKSKILQLHIAHFNNK